MTNQQTVLGPGGGPTVLALHGLPDVDVGPREQLRSIRQALQLPTGCWRDWVWASGRMGAGRARFSLENRSFATNYASRFSQWLSGQIADDNDADDPIHIIAYSLGALIIFKWLAELATPQLTRRIKTVFCLGGPHQFDQPEQEVILERTGQLITVREDSIATRDIVANLSSWQLVVLVAERDLSITGAMSQFPTVLSRSVVDQHTIGGTTHLTLCDHPTDLRIDC